MTWHLRQDLDPMMDKAQSWPSGCEQEELD